MILQELAALYDRLARQPGASDTIPAPGWSRESVGWALVLNVDGGVKDIQPLGTRDEKDRLHPLKMLVPEHDGRSGKSPKAYFLCDKASYLLGIGAKESDSSRERSRTLHHAVLGSCDDDGARAVLSFFDSPQSLGMVGDGLLEELSVGKMMVFCLERAGDFIHDRAAIRDAWADYLKNAPGDGPEGCCSVTGEFGRLARLFPQVTGVPGAQSSGASLVSFNFDASESYGKTQAYNASMSEDVAFKAGTALKYLLGKDDRRILLGSTIVTFWSDRPAPREEGLIAVLLNGRGPAEDGVTNQSIARAFEEMRKGLPLSEFDGCVGFSILGISPNAARLSVRFYERRSLGRIAECYGQFLRDVAMVGVERYSIWGFLLQTACLGKAENVPSTLVSRSFEAMLRGTDFPLALEQLVLSRTRADHGANKPWDMGQRAAILKGCLVRRARRRGHEVTGEESFGMALNRENKNIGYLLGRLFAVMERAQQGALGDTNATIRDRYIGAASSTPARVFQPLLRGCQVHLSTLRKNNKYWLLRLLESEFDEIVGELLPGGGDLLPKTLGMEEQGAFFIGYYQERHVLWHSKNTKAENSSSVEDNAELEEE